ncbi:MAG: alginate export family protein [Ginsengibacter sp.]
MKLKIFIIAIVSLFLIIPFISNAQEAPVQQLEINLQIRPRAEVRHGLFTPIIQGQKSASFISQRSRLGFVYAKDNKLKVGITTQVVNVWGGDPQVQVTGNNVTLYEAWGQYSLSSEWLIKAGRQVLSYDDERILGALDWSNAGRKHDALLVAFKKNKWQVHGAVAYNQNSERVTGDFFDNSQSQPYKSMEFIWVKYLSDKALSFSFLGMNNNFQSRIDSLNSNLQTVGSNIYFNKNKLKVQGSAYFQTGKNHRKNVADFNTSAWMAALKLNYAVNKNWDLSAGGDILSGKDMNSTSATITNFNPLYGTHHKFYGSMDYFYVSSGHDNTGIVDLYASATMKPTTVFSTQLAVHRFSAAALVVNAQQNKADKYLGTEADLSFSYKIDKEVNITGGYSQMFTSSSMKVVKNVPSQQSLANNQNWIWLMINITPQIIFKSK